MQFLQCQWEPVALLMLFGYKVKYYIAQHPLINLLLSCYVAISVWSFGNMSLTTFYSRDEGITFFYFRFVTYGPMTPAALQPISSWFVPN
jgi:hypothetical protein